MKCKCPVCHGTGMVEAILKPKIDRTGYAKAAKRLRAQGFTIRQIAIMLGYKHPGSISHLLNSST